MRHSSSRSALVSALWLLVVACDPGTAPPPHVLPPATPNAAGAVNFFAAKTLSRAGSDVQTITFDLDERPHELFMEPFVLHVQLGGASVVRGSVLVDGVPVLDHRDLAAIGLDAYSLEVPITPASHVTVELSGRASGDLTFWIDAPLQPPPAFTIVWPSRHASSAGAFLQEGTLDSSDVLISGSVCDERFPITELEVAGVAVAVPGTNLCEQFAVTQESPWGMSIITGRARNSRGREGAVVQAYTRGPEHYELPSVALAETRVRGVYSHLAQSALDDGSRQDADDLATLLKAAMDEVPIVIPASVAVSCNDVFELRIRQQTLRHAVIINALSATATHLAVDISIANPRIAAQLRADPLQPSDDNCDGTIVENAEIFATSVRVTANVLVESSPPNLPPAAVVRVTNPQAIVTGANARSTSAVADAFLSGLSIVSAALIESFVGDVLLAAVVPIVQDLANGMVPSIAREFPLNDATIRLETGLAGVEHGSGFLRLGLFGILAPVTQAPGAVAPRGPLRALCGATVACPNSRVPMPPFSLGTNTFAVAIHQDLVNQAFWSAWRAGAFTHTEPGFTFNATMPPVSMARVAGDPVGEIRWGDLRVSTTFDPVALGQPAGDPIVVESWVSATLRGNVAFDNGARALTLSDVTTALDVQLIEPLLPFDAAVVRSAIADRLREPLTEFTRDGLGVVPIPDGAPRLVNVVVSRSGLFYILAGTLQ